MKLMMSNIFSYRQLCGFLVIASISVSVRAEPCDPAPGNQYEKIFCQLKRSGRGQELSTLHDFRKNPPLTQAFLLKKPAERAGITLRIPERHNTETVDRQADLLLKTTGSNASAITAPPRPTADPKALAKTVVSVAPVAPGQPETGKKILPVEKTNPLESCVLRDFALQCEHGMFRLVTNRANQHLEEGMLSEGHRLGLPVFQGKASDREALEQYWQQAYSRYLAGMMEIGLGASTLSYSKFVHLYNHLVSQQLNFAERFETMYHFLKLDKSSIGVSTRPVIAEGFTTRYCSELSPELLACEYQRDNYIFTKSPTL